MNFKKLLPVLICLITFQVGYAQYEATVSSKDLQPLIGEWEGTITYLDYSTNKPFTMAAALDIKQVGKTNMYVFSNSYPQEPKANSDDTVTISEDGKMIDKQVIKSKRTLTNGSLEITTEYLATDGNDNKPAIIRNTYIIGKNVYVNRKDVQFMRGGNWLRRSEYAFNRK